MLARGFQDWRAVAVTGRGAEVLLWLGTAPRAIKDGYETAYFEALHVRVREQVELIRLECWHGEPECGTWEARGLLPVPIFRPAGLN